MSDVSPRRRHSPRTVAGAGAVVAGALALVLRLSLADGESLDLEGFDEWLAFIRDNGGFGALEFAFSNYAPLYSYVLLLGTYLPGWFGDEAILKGPPIVADFVCAAVVYWIVRRQRDELIAVTAFAVVLFTPTVLLNGAHWGQTDMIWTAAVVASLAFVLNGRPAAMIAFGVAFAFKQQALFFAPFLLLLGLKRVIPWRHFLLVPAVYLVSIIPALIAGRSLWNLLTIYQRQAEDKTRLTLNAPLSGSGCPKAIRPSSPVPH